jgi:hypothetical protein
MAETKSTHDLAVATEGQLHEGTNIAADERAPATPKRAEPGSKAEGAAAEGAPRQVQPDGR